MQFFNMENVMTNAIRRFFLSATLFTLLPALCLGGVGIAADATGYARPISYSGSELADGVSLWQYNYSDLYGGAQCITILGVDLNNPNVEVGLALCPEKTRAKVSSMAKEHNAVAAVNFGYFNMADPSCAAGALKCDGVVENTAEVGGEASGVVAFNSKEVIFAPYKDFDFANTPYPNYRASFPLLVKDGLVYDKIGTYDHTLGRHPRTVIGVTAENKLYLVTVDGRSKSNAVGMTCPELADLMQRMGCVWAMNMDGGGSTVMWTEKFGVVNHPTDNGKYDAEGERRVYDTFYVRSK